MLETSVLRQAPACLSPATVWAATRAALQTDVMTARRLRELAQAYRVRAIDDAPFTPLPLADQALEEDEAALKARMRQLSYEVPAGEWRPIPCLGEPVSQPRRFIDGSVFSRTVAVFTVEGRRRPAVLACVGALALELDGRRLVRSSGSLRLETVLCLLSNGIPPEDLQALSDGLEALGIRLVASETTDLTADFDVLRRRCWDMAKQRMEDEERAVLLQAPEVPAVVDGLLERRLTTVASQEMPVIGMVKRQMRRYLPESHINLLYELRPGERTPAFLLETEHAFIVSWYVRLSAADTLSPGYGVVRLTAPREYLERRFPRRAERWAEISAVSHWLHGLRHREQSYARAGISLEPIVRVEDELHALLPAVGREAAKLHRALGV